MQLPSQTHNRWRTRWLVALAGIGVGLQAGDPAAPSLAARLAPFVAHHSLAGAVMVVAAKDRVLRTETVGFADLATRAPMKPDTLFWIASQSKAMTAAALLMLVDEGRVSLEAPVATYLPEFKDQMLVVERDAAHTLLRRPPHPITVREILTHTSGLPFTSALEEPTLDALPLRVAVRSYAMTPLQFAPGTRYQYSNAGFNTAGRILEVVSGMPYEQFMERRLFQPLGMKDTTFWPTARQLQRLAKSYRANGDHTGLEETSITQLHYPLSDRRHRFPMPAGGLFSTARDVAGFCQMVLNGGELGGRRLLSPAAVKAMTTRQTGPGLPQSYGFGWAIGDAWYGHGGAYATDMTVEWRRGLVLVWMVQHASYSGDGAKSLEAFKQAALAEHWER